MSGKTDLGRGLIFADKQMRDLHTKKPIVKHSVSLVKHKQIDLTPSKNRSNFRSLLVKDFPLFSGEIASPVRKVNASPTQNSRLDRPPILS
jgi:hypothetical protein